MSAGLHNRETHKNKSCRLDKARFSDRLLYIKDALNLILREAGKYEVNANTFYNQPEKYRRGFLKNHVKITDNGELEFFIEGIPLENGVFLLENRIKRDKIADPSNPEKLIYDTMQEYPPTSVTLFSIKRILALSGVVSHHAVYAADIKASEIEDKNSPGGKTGYMSIVISPEDLNLKTLFAQTVRDLNPLHLNRELLIHLIDKERLAAFWDYKDFIVQFYEQIIEGNSRVLLKQSQRKEVIVINEQELIKKFGNEELQKSGIIPDEIKQPEHHLLGFKLSNHRFLYDGNTYFIIPNDGINPGFPSNTRGNVQRKDEFHTLKRTFLDHIREAGINKKGEGYDIYSNINDNPSAERGSLIVKPGQEMAKSFAAQYHGKIESIISGSSSSLHLDINTGKAITSTIIAGLSPELLARDIDENTLRAVYAEQQAEEAFLQQDKSGRKFKNLIRDKFGFPSPYAVLSLRKQFRGLTARYLGPDTKGLDTGEFLTYPVFQSLIGTQ